MRIARLRSLLQPWLLLAAIGGLIHAFDHHNVIVDRSRDARNSLDPKTVQVLQLLPQPLVVVALVPDEGGLHTGIGDFFARYRRHKGDLQLRFVDPRQDSTAPDARRGHLGEILLEYAGRTEHLSALNERATTNALARLARTGDRYITFLASNGERRVGRDANHDLSRFGAALEQRGLRVREYALGRTQAIPANTAVLVLASPSIAYTAAEQDDIERYVAAGGNLLWLTEPDAADTLKPLERALGFARFPGTIVDPLGLTKFKNPGYAVALDPVPHVVLAGFNQTVAFPFAAALVAKPNIDWQATTLAHTGGEAWNETGTFAGNVGYDAPDEVKGELNLALALTKPRRGGGEQRVVIIGDGDFLANSFVDNLGNLEFGRRVLEWLAADDALIDIALPSVPDGVLALELWQRLTIFLFFGVGLPLAFAANGFTLWWRRRHA